MRQQQQQVQGWTKNPLTSFAGSTASTTDHGTPLEAPMHHHYADITSRIPEPPKWWDEEAVPRYCDFAPDETANIYAREVALVEIACQGCAARFLVAFSQQHPFNFYTGKPIPSLTKLALDGALHYGDPPNAGCCASGPTMNSEPLRVVEFWRQEHGDWTRVPELEVAQSAPWSA